MTDRLYYRDSFLREFDAQVVSCEPNPGPAGDRWRVVLDRTAFYPTSGGQPHDIGKLGAADVVEVADSDDGHGIVHYTTAAIPPGAVRGTIHWPLRIDHMQQHTGQHILSAAFVELFQFPTVSFHLGKETSTIDLQAPSVVPRHLEEAERRANEIIFDDRVIAVRFGTAEELEEAGIRKKVEREGILRAVEIEGFDRQPCGGTHLARTGQAGALLLRKLERRRDTWRIEFVCGFRALAAARGDFAALAQAASLLSCGLPDVPASLTKVLEERRTLHSSTKRMEDRLADLEARDLLSKGATIGSSDAMCVSAVLEDATPTYLALLAAKITAEANVVALLASRTAGHIVFAQTKGATRDMGALLREALGAFGGKGGGTKDFAQGKLPNPGDADRVVEFAREQLSQK
ncbi:MAG TPA: DHHA1 domain-containing protein [Candidatus Acidoferrales bacterium]|nr:DHHA1 domain-containing protein [Candidatus Acidoferrales bacterium]